jgi:hypothetical protein
MRMSLASAPAVTDVKPPVKENPQGMNTLERSALLLSFTLPTQAAMFDPFTPSSSLLPMEIIAQNEPVAV